MLKDKDFVKEDKKGSFVEVQKALKMVDMEDSLEEQKEFGLDTCFGQKRKRNHF